MSIQAEIIEELGVTADFDVLNEYKWRIKFLQNYLKKTHCSAYVLGISGGIDSTVAGKLAQIAVSSVSGAKFIAVRLPYGRQMDEDDAQRALEFIDPDRVLTIDIKKPTDELANELFLCDGFNATDYNFHVGNIKARQRMIAQYAIAGANNGLVIGTDHAAEALMGFFTKFGDGAADITPLAGLNKRRIRAIAEYMKVPHELIYKTPTADLESDKPLKPDEEAFGVTYDEIDDFLEGKKISRESQKIIIDIYTKTAHKRALPVTPND